ncbi:hypothetical protein OPV22_003107 [Ensete ventricosum]|uniref:Uncharacterized protein n=1 Tax=Ensete ventricosum TaxID=4639 RepID=A0AAV8RZM3_ENSVE|nr:hypothetical protein OPV22_003107 [Ensete ventricosum]
MVFGPFGPFLPRLRGECCSLLGEVRRRIPLPGAAAFFYRLCLLPTKPPISGDKRAKAAGAAAPSSAGSGAKRAGATVHSSLSPGRKGTGVAGGSDHKRVDGAGDAAPSSSSPLAPGPPDPGKAPSSTSSFCVLSSGVSDRFKNASQDFIEFDDSS